MLPGSDSNSSLDRSPTPLEQAAIAWVVRCASGLDAHQERQLAEWLAADARHRELFQEFGGTWTLMGRARERVAPADGPAGMREPYESSAYSAPRRSGVGRIVAFTTVTLAAAAALAVALLEPWNRERGGSATVTEVGASRQIKLIDGSIIELNTDSAVSTVFSGSERRVRLTKGEAYFQVAKDAARPFVVEASGVGVRAVGTAFNVRVRSEAVEVLVTEGQVRVAPAAAMLAQSNTPATSVGSSVAALPSTSEVSAAPAEVGAGERVIVPIATSMPAAPPRLEVGRVSAEEIRRALAWQDRRLEFSDTPLGEMVAEFNRYNRHRLAVPDADLAAMRFGGSFRSSDRAGFVRMLRESFGITAEESENQTVLRATR